MEVVKKIWDIVSTLIVVAVVLLAMALVGVRVLGYEVFTVLSGSMEPVYSPGDLIYVKEVDPYTIQPGTIITFMVNEDTVATHRVVGAVESEEEQGLVRYRTKGDANDMEDGTLVHPNNIIGTPVYCIPKLGIVANYISSPPGMYIAIAGAALFLALMFVPDLLADDEEEESKPKKKGKKEETETV